MIPKFKKDMVYQQLGTAIESGRYAPGEKLPKELDFARQLGVSFITLRAALARLEAEKLIVRIPGKGTFVRELPTANAQLVNSAARVLLLLPDFMGDVKQENIFNRDLILGAAQQGFVEHLEIVPANFADAPSLLNSGGVAGVIWDRPRPECQPEIQRLQTEKIPQLTINRAVAGIPQIASNYTASVVIALRYLRSIGHTHIALIDHAPADVAVFQERQTAFRQQLERHGVAQPDALLFTVSPHEEQLDARLYDFFQSQPQITAVIVNSPFVELLHRYLTEEMIGVPGELSVIQWGENRDFPRDGKQPYTLLTDPRHQVGEQAVHLLAQFSAHSGDFPINNLLIDGELLLRQGCAIPRQLRRNSA